ncbi:MAG: formimidoylglutamase [Flavobacteriaceae bacterium]|nr:formimidoylglutamase [Flavobacteriaceae bacterium]
MEHFYKKPDKSNWKGRNSDSQEYLHEKVILKDLSEEFQLPSGQPAYALLGYACDEGVRRNSGRPGAVEGPDAIRKELGKLSNHLQKEVLLVDTGNILCPKGDLEGSQEMLAKKTATLVNSGGIPILLGGGHDIAYGHYRGLRRALHKEKKLGIINFDAHFDLRTNVNGNHSGSPFFQIAQDCDTDGESFEYICLGIRKEANPPELFETASELGVKHISLTEFSMHHFNTVKEALDIFLSKVDKLYVTIDMDGFSSAFSPGVSASSPIGFSPEIVYASLKILINSGKLLGIDVAETNPAFDIDQQTAKLAAGIIHYIIHEHALL